MPKAVIFDVDGTLVDSVDLHARAWHEAFADFGFNFDTGSIRGQIGKGGDQLMPVFLSPEELDKHGAAIDHHRSALFKDRYLQQVRPFPAVRDLFQHVLHDGKRVALASSSKQDELEHYKRVANIGDLVEAHTTSEDAEQSKPQPDIFQAALQRLPGVAAHDAIVIGDTPYDAQAAAKAGIRTIGLLCGGFAEDDLRKAGCIAIYRDPADLLARYADSVLAR
ncbi:MAG: HAD family hydrolase [Rhodospirillales bacterium 20-64-7]|nr:MAG: HAD family hydrolase [Rhodospirillales bacterium 20-64-7]HQT77967.1 HAD family phosphatase [Rhodopila sp.]